MSVELIKKPINLYQVIDEQQKEELMETGIIVPDSKPDVLDVLAVDSNVVVKTREKTGRVMEIGGEHLRTGRVHRIASCAYLPPRCCLTSL